MYQEMLSNDEYSNWSEYCTLVDLAQEEYEEEQAKLAYEEECARLEYEKEQSETNNK